MIQRYGTDTSVLVRLVTGEPQTDFQLCVEELRALTEKQEAQIYASNQVIGEAYIVLQRYYRISADDARAELAKALTSGLVSPLNGQSVILALRATGNPGLFDRLIADGYQREGIGTLTLDRQMAQLTGVRRI